jgi:hypothetical protein
MCFHQRNIKSTHFFLLRVVSPVLCIWYLIMISQTEAAFLLAVLSFIIFQIASQIYNSTYTVEGHVFPSMEYHLHISTCFSHLELSLIFDYDVSSSHAPFFVFGFIISNSVSDFGKHLFPSIEYHINTSLLVRVGSTVLSIWYFWYDIFLTEPTPYKLSFKIRS